MSDTNHDGLMAHISAACDAFFSLARAVRARTALDPGAIDAIQHGKGKRAEVLAACDRARGHLAKAIFATTCYRDMTPATESIEDPELRELELRQAFDSYIALLERVDAAVLEIRQAIEPKRFRRRDRCARACWALLDADIELNRLDEELSSAVDVYHEWGYLTPLGAYKDWESLRKAAGEHASDVPAEILDGMRLTGFPGPRLNAITIAQIARAAYTANQRIAVQRTEASERRPLQKPNGVHAVQEGGAP